MNFLFKIITRIIHVERARADIVAFFTAKGYGWTRVRAFIEKVFNFSFEKNCSVSTRLKSLITRRSVGF